MAEKPSQEIRGLLKLLILNELDNNEATGYELIKRISTKITKKPSPGSVYPILKELASNGILECREEGSRKVYRLSEKGKELLEKIYYTEKEAIFNKAKILRLAGILNDEEAEYINTYVSEMRMDWLRLYKLNGWLKFLDLAAKASKINKEYVETIIKEMSEKLESFLRGEVNEKN